LKLPSGSSQSVTVSLPSAPPENVTVTVTPSSGIKATPATLAFAPTVFSGTVTVESTATPGTTGTVKFSAPGYADGVVNVTVEQSTNLVVDPASLKIPANGTEPFKVKLANAPTNPVTVTVETSTPDLITTPASLLFTPANFKTGQTVFVSTGPRAVPEEQSILLDAGPLGQFKLPVTITSAPNTLFFIDSQSGSDNNPGTAARPWQSVKNVLDGNQPTGLRVAAAASAGNDVVVTILAGGNQPAGGAISTPILPAGSVTVLKAPSAGTFTLNMGDKTLTLNEGYKLQDIDITSNFTSSGGSVTVVTINAPTAGLASVNVKCEGTSSYTITCVKVTGSGSHTLKDVTVDVKDSNASNIGILIDANANLSIVGGTVKLNAVASSSQQPITLIQSDGVLTATGLTVDMVDGSVNTHQKDSNCIVLNKAGSSVTDSTIKVNNSTVSGQNAVGIVVGHTTGRSTVARNNFIGSGTGAVAVTGIGRLDFVGNNFSGTFNSAGPVQP
jgi:hypothetical protein